MSQALDKDRPSISGTEQTRESPTHCKPSLHKLCWYWFLEFGESRTLRMTGCLVAGSACSQCRPVGLWRKRELHSSMLLEFEDSRDPKPSAQPP